MVALVELHS